MATFDIQPEKLVGLSDEDFRAPDLIGTVEGWRAWNVNPTPPPFGNPPKLFSATWDYYWSPRIKARADCHKRGGQDHVPGEGCTCGFYSAKTLTHLRSMGYHVYDEGSMTVVGRLANWGKVIEGNQGWRSEFAYPVKLYVPFEGWRLAKPLSKAYGVPVELLNLLDPTKQPGQGRVIEDHG